MICCCLASIHWLISVSVVHHCPLGSLAAGKPSRLIQRAMVSGDLRLHALAIAGNPSISSLFMNTKYSTL